MILGPISLLDCLAFCVFLTPQLLLHVGLFRTLFTAIQALPFLLLQLPLELIEERYWRRAATRPSFVQRHTLFEDLVVRCVRYAFSNFPASVGRVFFSKGVAVPFTRWRMLRHGYLKCPVHWHECTVGEGNDKTRGLWIKYQADKPPDFVVYYVHGGGFAMGSCYFYMEFLLAWHQLLVDSGFENPAIFALDYALVPDDVYPKQVVETVSGYKHVLDVVDDPSKVCVAGDSAGATLILSLLLEIAAQHGSKGKRKSRLSEPNGKKDTRPAALGVPRIATLISPWVTLKTNIHYPSHIDYLDRSVLWEYAREYAGEAMIQQSPASPGTCLDVDLWRAASPQRGYFVTYGDEEVFAADVESFIQRQIEARIEIQGLRYVDEVHAWPVASLFLSNTEEKRLKGLRAIVSEIRRRSIDGDVKKRVVMR